MKSTIRILLAAVGLCLAVGGTALAQNATTGAIQGRVSDQSNGEGLAGVTVVVTSPALQGTQSAGITESDGTFKISNLPPGTYIATYYYSDITVRRTNVEVQLNKTTPAFVKIGYTVVLRAIFEKGGEAIVRATISATSGNQVDGL